MPQAHMRAQADTLGGGPVFSAPPPEQQRVKPGDTLGGGPVFSAPPPEQQRVKPGDTLGGGPVLAVGSGN